MDACARLERGLVEAASLRQILPDADMLGCADIRIDHADWRLDRVGPGGVFVCLDHESESREILAELAAKRGASALLTSQRLETSALPVVVVRDPRVAIGRIAEVLAGSPSSTLRVVAVTGPSACGITCRMLHAILQASGHRAGAVHTAGWFDGLRNYPQPCNEPNGPERSAMLCQMRERRTTDAVVEFSDDALDRRDAAGLLLEALVVTPTAIGSRPPDGFDARKRLSSLARAARRLRTGGAIVLPAAEPELELLAGSALQSHPITYGLSGPADVAAWIEAFDTTATTIRLVGMQGGLEVRVPIAGIEAVGAAIAAATAAFALGASPTAIRWGLESFDESILTMEPIEEQPATTLLPLDQSGRHTTPDRILERIRRGA